MKSLRTLAKKSPFVKLLGIGKRYLATNGYWQAFPSDASGAAVPWFTYPAIQFLKGVMQASWNVFEYGSGSSTVFWNASCARTVSVEHDELWFRRLKERYPGFEIRWVPEGFDAGRRLTANLVSSFEAKAFDLVTSERREHDIEHGLLNRGFANYAAQITEFPKGAFDVIVVDGMARCLCLFAAAEWVADGGLIILDNSDRWQYNALQEYLMRARGFKRIDFQGLGPLNIYGWTTSIFFRNDAFLEWAEPRRQRGSGDLGW